MTTSLLTSELGSRRRRDHKVQGKVSDALYASDYDDELLRSRSLFCCRVWIQHEPIVCHINRPCSASMMISLILEQVFGLDKDRIDLQLPQSMLNVADFKGNPDPDVPQLDAIADVRALGVHHFTLTSDMFLNPDRQTTVRIGISDDLVDRAQDAFLKDAANGDYISVRRRQQCQLADVDGADKKGCTALHLAVANGHLHIVRYLLMHGANINAVSMDHWTPLHIACKIGRLDLAELLLSVGADPTILTKAGESLTDLAEGYTALLDLLADEQQYNAVI